MRVRIEGVKETRKAIRQFAPELNKELNSELRAALGPIAKKAKGFELMKVKSLAEVQSDALNGKFDDGSYDGAVLLLSTREADGSFQIKYVIQNGAIITSSLIHLVSLQKENLEKDKVEEKAANDEMSRDEAIKQAASA